MSAAPYPAPLEWRRDDFLPNIAQCGDGLALLQSLPDACTPLVFFDPQHRAVMDHLKFGNEGARQRGRAQLPAMIEQYIETCCRETARLLVPNGYLIMLWVDTFCLIEAHHKRVADALKGVGLVAWNNLRPGTRCCRTTSRRSPSLSAVATPPWQCAR